jgi:hypothetical protein
VILYFTDESIRVPLALYELLSDETKRLSSKALSDHCFSRFEDDVFSTLDQVKPVRKLSLAEMEEESLALSQEQQKEYWVVETQAALQNLAQEQERLERLVREEEEALEREKSQLKEEREHLTTDIIELKQMQQQTGQVQEKTRLLQLDAQKSAFLLEAQRIRLFRQLRTIYPVTMETCTETDQRYRICGLEIPPDLAGNQVAEEQLAASMGYLCHVVTMMAKYLTIQLRFRLYCRSSQSAVQDEMGRIYPLFTRNVDREEFERGARLLWRNVDALACSLRIRTSPQLHVLAKVKRIYEYVIDGY